MKFQNSATKRNLNISELVFRGRNTAVTVPIGLYHKCGDRKHMIFFMMNLNDAMATGKDNSRTRKHNNNILSILINVQVDNYEGVACKTRNVQYRRTKENLPSLRQIKHLCVYELILLHPTLKKLESCLLSQQTTVESLKGMLSDE